MAAATAPQSQPQVAAEEDDEFGRLVKKIKAAERLGDEAMVGRLKRKLEEL